MRLVMKKTTFSWLWFWIIDRNAKSAHKIMEIPEVRRPRWFWIRMRFHQKVDLIVAFSSVGFYEAFMASIREDAFESGRQQGLTEAKRFADHQKQTEKSGAVITDTEKSVVH